MKRGLILSVVIALLLISTAFADLTVTDFTLGDSNTMRMNSEGDDNSDQIGDTESATFTVTNNDTAVSSAGISFSGTLAADFNLSYTTPSEWANGTTTVTVTGQLPEDWDSRTEDEEEQAILVLADALTVSGAGVADATGDMYAEAEPGLTLDDVEIVIDGVVYDFDDDEVSEIIPGSDLEIKLLVTNEFDKDSNIEINDVEVSLDSSNSDIDFDNDDDDFDLNEEDDQTFSTDFDVDWDDVEDGDDTTITVTVIGTDVNGATHTIILEFDMEIEYPEADVSINGFSVSPSAACAGDRVTVSYDVENVGTDDQDNLRGKIEETSLEWEEVISNFKLDGRDDEDTEEESITEAFTIPSTAAEGDYSVKVYAYFEDKDGDDDYKWEAKTLTVIDCDGTSGTTSGSTGTSGTTTGDTSSSDGMVVGGTTTSDGSTTADTSASTSTSTVTATSKPKTNDGLLIAGLVVLVVLLAGVVVSMVLMLKK